MREVTLYSSEVLFEHWIAERLRARACSSVKVARRNVIKYLAVANRRDILAAKHIYHALRTKQTFV